MSLKIKISRHNEIHMTAKIHRMQCNFVENSCDASGRKVSQECSHSFRLTLSRPTSNIKEHKYFNLGKVGIFLTAEKITLNIAITRIRKKFQQLH